MWDAKEALLYKDKSSSGGKIEAKGLQGSSRVRGVNEGKSMERERIAQEGADRAF